MNHKKDPTLNILREIADLCEHVTLTGALKGGREALVARYNQVLAKLVREGRVEDGLFLPLGPEASFDVIGVEARMLRSSAGVSPASGEDAPADIETIVALAPFARGEDLAKLIHGYLDTGRQVPSHLLPGLAPFIRSEDLAFLMERVMNAGKPEPPREPTAPSAKPGLERVAHPVEIVDDEASFRNPALTPEQRLAAAERLIRLHSEHLD